MSVEGAAKRISDESKKALEMAILAVFPSLVKYLREAVANRLADDDKIVEYMVVHGVEDPSPDDFIDAAEAVYGDVEIDFDELYKEIPKPFRVAVDGLIAFAKKVLPAEKLEKLTYENVLEYAKKKSIEDVEKFMEKHPKLSRKIIEWLRKRVLE